MLRQDASEEASEETAGLQLYYFIRKETLAQVFSCEFCEIFEGERKKFLKNW